MSIVVTADGGLVAISGSHVVASAAKHHATPVVVCACLHSMTSSYLINDSDAYHLCVSPEKVLRFDACMYTWFYLYWSFF